MQEVFNIGRRKFSCRLTPNPRKPITIQQKRHLSQHSQPRALSWRIRRRATPVEIPIESPKKKWNILNPSEFLRAKLDYRNLLRDYLRNGMKSHVQILTTPTADTPSTALLLHFDNKRYLFGNVAEGTQRVAQQRKLGLIKLGHLFLTGTVNWHSTGGLLGMILTVSDSVNSSKAERNAGDGKFKSKREKQLKELGTEDEPESTWLGLHGGKNLAHLIATARRFIFRTGTPLRVTEYLKKDDGKKEDWVPSFEDENIRVWSMVLEPAMTAQEGTTSPRKRSHDEFKSGVPDGKQETEEEREERYDQMRKSVVTSMFDSNWKLDTLIRSKLSQVKLPAAIFFRDEQGKIQKWDGPTMADDPTLEDREVLVRNPWPGAEVETLPPTTPSKSSVCYVVKNHPQRGKFDVKKAIALKVKKGPDYRKLTVGESVVSEDGKTITPDMVLGQGKDGGGFVIVELPDASYIEPLITREEWSAKELMNEVGAVFWLLGEGVVNDPRLQTFMKEQSNLKHIVSSKDTNVNYIALESAATAAIRLHLLDSERFPIPKYSHELKTPLPTDSPLPYTIAKCGHILQLEPSVQLKEDSVVPYLDTKAVVKEADKDILELAEVAHRKITDPEYLKELEFQQKDLPFQDVEVISLGTGSSLPSKYRNVSATLVRVPGSGSYLLDAGENTMGQLGRVFGDELPEVLSDLKMIWISHLHADHHLGTVSVIKAWAEETAKRGQTEDNLVVASHSGMTNWLQEYSKVEDFGYERIWPVTFDLQSSVEGFYHPKRLALTKFHGIEGIRVAEVRHCHGALAVYIKLTNGFNFAYSGDCRPCPAFARMASGATLLIHEATFDDELGGDAKAKKHSTTSEALDIARQMNARRILLTHFSQRYQKIPVMKKEKDRDQVAIVAFDYMRCKLGDFAKLEWFKPALMKLYEDETAGQKDKDDE